MQSTEQCARDEIGMCGQLSSDPLRLGMVSVYCQPDTKLLLVQISAILGDPNQET